MKLLIPKHLEDMPYTYQVIMRCNLVGILLENQTVRVVKNRWFTLPKDPVTLHTWDTLGLNEMI